MEASRRNFLKISGRGIMAAAAMAYVPWLSACGTQKQYPSAWNSKDNGELQTIDSYVQKYVDEMIEEPSSETKEIIEANTGNIHKYSLEYGVPTNLLACVIANETERRSSRAKTEFLEEIYKKAFPDTPLQGAGVARMKVPIAANLLYDLSKSKGVDYVAHGTGIDTEKFKNLISALRKWDERVPYKNIPQNDELTSMILNVLKSDKVSVELAAMNLKNLIGPHETGSFSNHYKQKTSNGRVVSLEFNPDHPVHTRLLIQGHLGGVDAIEWDKPENSNQRNMIDYSGRALSMLRSGSYLDMKFGVHGKREGSPDLYQSKVYQDAVQQIKNGLVLRNNMDFTSSGIEFLGVYLNHIKSSDSELRKVAAYSRMQALRSFKKSTSPIVILPYNNGIRKNLNNYIPEIWNDYRNISKGLVGKEVYLPGLVADKILLPPKELPQKY